MTNRSQIRSHWQGLMLISLCAVLISGLLAMGNVDKKSRAQLGKAPGDRSVEAVPQNPTKWLRGSNLFFGTRTNPWPADGIINVNSTAQSPGVTGDCTLGEAIQAANANVAVDGCSAGTGVGADTIMLPAGTYTLTTAAYDDHFVFGASGLPAVLSDIMFQGGGSDKTIIERDPNAPHFRLMLIGDESVGSITVNDVTMRGGNTDDIGGAAFSRGARPMTFNRVVFENNRATNWGGAIGNHFSAVVIATDCVFTNNEAGFEGGAIHAPKLTVSNGKFTGNKAINGGAISYYGGAGGNFEISDSEFTNNKALGSNGFGGLGGAIYFSGTATITRSRFTGSTTTNSGSRGGAIKLEGGILNLFDSVVQDNQADYGGGIHAENSAIHLERTTIANNTATPHDGGGIYINSSSTNATISNSTISGNSAHLDGGGLWTSTVNVSVTNTTLDTNASGQYGGGIYAQSFAAVTLALNNVTISTNHAASQGGGILIFHPTVNVSSANSIIALNTADLNSPDLYAPSSFTSLGYNLIGIKDGANFVNAAGDQTGTTATPIDPLLGPLQNNGGTTFTRALLAGSPALDSANPAEPGSEKGACEPTDQRGTSRPQDGDNNGSATCDIGAYEQIRVPVCITPPAGMTGWWPFDGNSNDILHGNNASLFGNQDFTTGKVDQALAFDGLDDHSVAPGDAALDVGGSDGMTFDLWFNPAEVQTARPLIEWESGAGPHLWMSADFAEGGRGVGSLFVNLPDATGSYHIFSSAPGLLTANTWQHVAVTYDKTSGVAKIFLNGALVAEQNFGSFRPQTTGDVFFGYRPFGVLAGRRFLGAMDEVEVFNRALNDTEIHDLYYADSAGKCKPAASPTPTPTPTPTPRSCLEGHVTWYRAENDALDSSGNNNGTPRNGATFAPGKVGQGFLLDGVDDYVECPDNTSLDPGIDSFTIDAWIKSSVTIGYQPILTKYECGGVCPATAKSYYALYIFDGKLQGSLRDTNGNEQTLTGTNTIADGNFHHVAMVRDVGAGELRIYVDGVVAVSASLIVTSTIQNDDGEADPLTIGFQRPPDLNPGAALYFNGLIDEVDYFSRALTTTEVAAIFNAGSAGKCSDSSPTVISINEVINVTDTPTLLPSAVIGIDEQIHVADSPTLLPSAMIGVDEQIHVADAPTLLPSAMIGVDEQVHVADTPTLQPSAMIGVDEQIHVADTPTLLPSAMIGIVEQVHVLDVPGLLLTQIIGTVPTPVGSNVTVQAGKVAITFDQVTAAGTTTITPVDPASTGPLPAGYQIAGTNLAFDITTTAKYSGDITICFAVPDVTDEKVFNELRILHNEGGVLIDRTSSLNFTTKTICATVKSLSPFVLAQLVSSPRSILQAIADDLKNLRANTTGRRDQQRLDEVIRHLEGALDPGNWLDQTHLAPSRGANVFGKIESAILQLSELIKDKRTGVPPTALQASIVQLLQTARLLAQTAIIDANSANGSSGEITNALTALFEADANVAAANYSLALGNYREAWRRATNARA